MRSASDVKLRGYSLHAVRVAVFAAIILLIHLQHRKLSSRRSDLPALTPSQAAEFYAEVAELTPPNSNGSQVVLNDSGNPMGSVLQTSPQSDRIIGFSGPTNALVAFDGQERIAGVKILSSQDTRDHVNQVRSDPAFLKSFIGMTREEVLAANEIDVVAGATLTSLAIREGINARLGGTRGSLKFPDPLSLESLQAFFPQVASIRPSDGDVTVWLAFGSNGKEVGSAIRTVPATDNIIGYQGPTESVIVRDSEGKAVGVFVGESYDNQPYVDYVREDKYFREQFAGMSLDELANLDLQAAGVEGVSGATMTSIAVAEGVVVAAKQQIELREAQRTNDGILAGLSKHDVGTAMVVGLGMVIGMTSLRSNSLVRVGFQLVVVGYLGLTTGNLLSQAMTVGWAQHGVPWRSAGGLAILSIAALSLPIFSRRNLYCTHLCAHGAAQQLLKRRRVRQIKVPRSLQTLLRLVPVLLLAWCIIVGMTSLGFSLVDIEPFDAYVFRIAGVATVTIAVAGLVASFFVPMAYCKYGCPTGALLNFLRLNGRSDRWSVRDWVAVGYLALAILLSFG